MNIKGTIGNLKFAKERRVRDITSSITVAATFGININIIVAMIIVMRVHSQETIKIIQDNFDHGVSLDQHLFMIIIIIKMIIIIIKLIIKMIIIQDDNDHGVSLDEPAGRRLSRPVSLGVPHLS